jgi:hypothetical protein
LHLGKDEELVATLCGATRGLCSKDATNYIPRGVSAQTCLEAAARIEALHAEREKLRERMRLIEFDATNKNSAPSARLQRIADYARATLSGKDSPDVP